MIDYDKIFTTENSHINAPRLYAYAVLASNSSAYVGTTDRQYTEKVAAKARDIISHSFYWDEVDERIYTLYRAQGLSPKAAFNKTWRG